MSSNKCRSLGAPYVSLTFDVKETDGSSSHHSTELTYEQFKVLLFFLLPFVYIKRLS